MTNELLQSPRCKNCQDQGIVTNKDGKTEACLFLNSPGHIRPAIEAGQKHDQEKAPMQLLSPIWLLGVARVLGFGAKKYSSHQWRKGIQQSRLLGAALRHILSFMGGEDLDPETGLSHLYHASCCLMFAAEMFETRPDMDDRYKGEKK